MSIYQALALLAAGIGGGIAGTMASVASVVSYPALLALGLPPLAANVTNTVALVFCVPGAALGARAELAGQRRRVLRIGAVMAAGGAAGAAVLLLAPPGAFALVVPVLIASAAVLILLQPRLRALAPRPGAEQSRRRLAGLFCVAVYLGYFGAAGGVLVLAALAATLSESLIRVNAIKNVVAGAANLVAATIFARYAPVDWAFVPTLSAGFLIGGYAGQRLVRHFPAALLRLVVAAAGLALAVKLGISAYG
ncbi:MAG TPA: sulfite exporter TauE/SafE family protein [Trebonia sp.]